MIIYDLRCQEGHQFEGWFKQQNNYIEQKTAGLLVCPICGSSNVHKLPTASRIRTGMPAKGPSRSQEKTSPKLATDKESFLQKFHEYIANNFDDVGQAFPEEARKIHYGETEKRNIRGTATSSEVEELQQEGVGITPLPPDPAEKNKLN